MNPYTDIDELRDVVLEASWIRTVVASPGRLTIMLEAVIAKDSPLLREPRPGDMYYWLPAVLQLEDVSDIRWSGQPASPNQDPDGSTDFGNLDHFSFEGQRYHLESGAGVIDAVAERVTLRIDERPER